MAASKPAIVNAEIVAGEAANASQTTMRLALTDSAGNPVDIADLVARIEALEAAEPAV